MKAKDLLDLDKKQDKVILSIYLVWVAIHIFLLIIGPTKGWVSPAEDFYPIINTEVSFTRTETELDFTRIGAYDLSEFFVYALAPVFIFIAYKLICSPKRIKNNPTFINSELQK